MQSEKMTYEVLVLIKTMAEKFAIPSDELIGETPELVMIDINTPTVPMAEFLRTSENGLFLNSETIRLMEKLHPAVSEQIMLKGIDFADYQFQPARGWTFITQTLWEDLMATWSTPAYEAAVINTSGVPF